MQQYPGKQSQQPFYPQQQQIYPQQQSIYSQQQPPMVPNTTQKPVKEPPPKWALGCVYILMIAAVLGLCAGAYSLTLGRSTPGSPSPTATSGTIAIASSTSPTATRPITQPTTMPTTKPTAKPTPRPTQKPAPTATAKPKCQAVNNNPWCYTFTTGNLIYRPPAAFCSYFPCISNFWNGRGYVNECGDGDYSKSGGIQGDCSHHGGKLRPLYSH